MKIILEVIVELEKKVLQHSIRMGGEAIGRW